MGHDGTWHRMTMRIRYVDVPPVQVLNFRNHLNWKTSRCPFQTFHQGATSKDSEGFSLGTATRFAPYAKRNWNATMSILSASFWLENQDPKYEPSGFSPPPQPPLLPLAVKQDSFGRRLFHLRKPHEMTKNVYPIVSNLGKASHLHQKTDNTPRDLKSDPATLPHSPTLMHLMF